MRGIRVHELMHRDAEDKGDDPSNKSDRIFRSVLDRRHESAANESISEKDQAEDEQRIHSAGTADAATCSDHSFSLWTSAARDAAEDESPRRDPSRAPPERRADLLDGIRVRRLAGDMDFGIGLSSLDAVADLGLQDHARPQIDRIALLLATRAKANGGDADAVRGDRGDECFAARYEAF